MRRKGLTLLAVGACGVGLAACGSSDDGDGSTSADARPAALTLVMTGDARAQRLALDGDAPQAGLTTVTFRNQARGAHEAQLVRVDGDHAQAEVLRTFAATNEAAPIPDWLRAAGGAGNADAGQTVTSTQVLEPGAYYAIDSNGGRRSAFVSFEVTGDASDAALPATDATITAKEYAFDASGLRAGTNEVHFVNDGREIHHVIALPLARGRTEADFRRFIASDGRGGPPPVDFDAGWNTSAFDGGTSGNVQLRLRRGEYVLVCFISDRRGGPPHAVFGMVREVTVE
jgi:hypothetical protein